VDLGFVLVLHEEKPVSKAFRGPCFAEILEPEDLSYVDPVQVRELDQFERVCAVVPSLDLRDPRRRALHEAGDLPLAEARLGPCFGQPPPDLGDELLPFRVCVASHVYPPCLST
jgi:hypothetical protein